MVQCHRFIFRSVDITQLSKGAIPMYNPWNATCLLSNLPIQAGQRCVGFLIAKGNEDGSTSFPDERYLPFSPPIFGGYNGYGSLDCPEDNYNFFSSLKNWFFFGDETLEAFLSSASKKDGVIITSKQWGHRQVTLHLVLVTYHFFDVAMSDPYINERIELFREEQSSFREMNLGQSIAFIRSGARFISSDVLNLIADGVDFGLTAGFTEILRMMRKQWCPTSGFGNQCSIEYGLVSQLYESFAHEADELFVVDAIRQGRR
jgi:hypothetical protein